MNKEDILKILEGAKDKNGDVPMRLVRQAFEKLSEPCEDAVSRADAFNAINDYVNTVGVLDGYADTQEVLRIVKRLPSAQPEPSDVARSIATIIENEQDMRVVLKNAQNDIVHCRDCKFCHKSPDWKHRQSFGESIWYCEENRGFNFAQTVGLDDYCSSAERRTDEQTD